MKISSAESIRYFKKLSTPNTKHPRVVKRKCNRFHFGGRVALRVTRFEPRYIDSFRSEGLSRNIEFLERALVREMENFPIKALRAVKDQRPTRLKSSVKAKGSITGE